MWAVRMAAEGGREWPGPARGIGSSPISQSAGDEPVSEASDADGSDGRVLAFDDVPSDVVADHILCYLSASELLRLGCVGSHAGTVFAHVRAAEV